MFDPHEFPRRAMLLVPLLLSLTVHEWAHAASAYLLGDDTASREGRFTLNPIVHMDPIGTFLAPMLGSPFGWAKPVPVNPVRFRRDVPMRFGNVLVSAAGPVSNLIIAVLCAIGLGLLVRFGKIGVGGGGVRYLLEQGGIRLNVALFLFNLLPVPPLDGSRVVDGYVPYRLRAYWDQWTQYGGIALLVLVMFGGGLMSRPIAFVCQPLFDLSARIAGA
jgi:Zn-dependent protease